MKGLLMKRLMVLTLVLTLGASSLAGCGKSGADNGNTAETTASSAANDTTGETQAPAKTSNDPVDPDAVALTIGDREVKASELFYYYYSMKYEMETFYEQQYGTPMDWNAMFAQEMTFGQYLKAMVESQVVQMVFWGEQESAKDMTLSEDEMEDVENGLISFMDVVSDEDKALYGFNEENIREAMEHSLLSGKILQAEMDTQIAALTEEEKADCVYRTVQHILFLTNNMPQETDADGNTAEPSEDAVAAYKAERLKEAEAVLARAEAGEDFEALAEEFNEDSGVEYSFNKAGQTIDGTSFVPEFVEGGNALKEGEMTIVETEYGYHILKCISENDEALYEQGLQNAALNKFNTTFAEWVNEKAPDFYDVWDAFAVLNPAAAPAESESETETESTTETETVAETESAAETESVAETETAAESETAAQ